MSDTVPTFSLMERDRRWALARTFMEREGLDGLIVFGEHEDAGPAPFCFDTWFTNDRPGTTIVYPRTGEPISLVPMPTFLNDNAESSGRGDVVWLTEKHVRMGRDSGAIVDVLTEHGLAKATVGVVGLDPYPPFHPEGIVPYTLWSTVQARLPDAKFKPVGPAFMRLTLTLGQEEIAVLRHAASIGDDMVRAMVDAAGPGVPESEVYAAGMAAGFARGTVVPGMHLWSGPELVAFGPPQWAYRPQAPRVLQHGDIINAEVFCNFGMRLTQHQATIAVGEVHEDYERAALVAQAAYEAGLRALRPTHTFGEVVDEMRKPVAAAGGMTPNPLVHSINPMALARGTGHDATSADMELAPGMSFVFEPRCAFGRRGVTVGGTVIVGEHEAIELSPYTAQLLRARTTASAHI